MSAPHQLILDAAAAGPRRPPEPGTWRQALLGFLGLLIAVGVLASVLGLLVLVVAPAAGAAGGCGGG